MATLVFMLAVPTVALAAEAPVGLGTAGSYAVLAGETITNTGPTTVTGDIGLHPGTDFTGQADVTILDGTVHLTDAAALQAKSDLAVAYDDAAGRAVTQDLTDQDLGGLTLTPGVYHFSSSAGLTGNLILDAQGDPNGVFIFQIGSELTTASGSSVSLLNGARFCRVFWQVGSSATLGTGSSFVGHIFALQSITATTGATVQGQLLARNGAVTLDTNTITNGFCANVAVDNTPNTSQAVTETVTGGELPKTATPWYTIFLIGFALTLIGIVFWVVSTKKRNLNR